jgi:hypothetical protein
MKMPNKEDSPEYDVDIKPGIYRHYKGKDYRVICIATNRETKEKMVVYQALYHDDEYGDMPIWVQPIERFAQDVFIDGKKMQRFACLNKE